MKICFKYRPAYGNKYEGRYTLSYMFGLYRRWYLNNGIIPKDLEVPDEKYLPSSDGFLFGYVEFDESVVSKLELEFDIVNGYEAYCNLYVLDAHFKFGTDSEMPLSPAGLSILTPDEAKTFLRTYTTCVESEQGFLTVPAHVNMEGVEVPDKFITIE